MMEFTKSQIVINCPHCDQASTYNIGLDELAEGKKVFCEKCGKEIVVDRTKLQKAERILANLKISADVSGTKTFDEDGAHVSVQTKTFKVDDVQVSDLGDLGKIIRDKVEEAGSQVKGAPEIECAPRIEPKGGCLGVLLVVVLVWGAAFLMNSL